MRVLRWVARVLRNLNRDELAEPRVWIFRPRNASIDTRHDLHSSILSNWRH
jgi:hypothetical protein